MCDVLVILGRLCAVGGSFVIAFDSSSRLARDLKSKVYRTHATANRISRARRFATSTKFRKLRCWRWFKHSYCFPTDRQCCVSTTLSTVIHKRSQFHRPRFFVYLFIFLIPSWKTNTYCLAVRDRLWKVDGTVGGRPNEDLISAANEFSRGKKNKNKADAVFFPPFDISSPSISIILLCRRFVYIYIFNLQISSRPARRNTRESDFNCKSNEIWFPRVFCARPRGKGAEFIKCTVCT